MSRHCGPLCASTDHLLDTNIKIHEVTTVWRINNFRFHEAIGTIMISPNFSAVSDNETEWFLQIGPNGENENNGIDENDHISFYVCYSAENSHQTAFAKYAVFFLCPAMIEEIPSPLNTERIDKYTAVDAHDSKPCWGWDNFQKKDSYFWNSLMNGDTLCIKCVITYSLADATADSIFHDCSLTRLYPNVPECNLSDQFALLLENHDLADVVLSVNGKKYPAHKLVLAARSPVFAAMFRHNTKENEENHVYIENMDEEVIGEMLRYIYTGKCEKLPELATGLLAAADKYDLDRLKMICAEELYKSLSVENAATVLAFADMHGVEKLKNRVIMFIASKSAEVSSTEGWKRIGSNLELINEVCLAIARR